MTVSSASPSVIYPAQGIMLLISHAWNLLRANLKSSILIILAPTLLFTLFHLLVGLLSGQTFLTSTTVSALTQDLLVGAVLILLAIPCFGLWIFSCCTLSRLYYSAITQEQPLSVKACWQYTLKRWFPTLGVTITLSISLLVMLALDFFILFIGLSLSFFILGALAVSTGNFQHIGSQVMMFLFLLVWGFVVLTFTIGMASFQGFFFTFPLLALSTGPSAPGSIWPRLKEAYRLLFKNLIRLTLFGVVLFCFSGALSVVLMSPAWIWAVLEMARLGLSQQHYIPLHVQSVLNIYSSLASLLMLPFHISALTLLWYDCQVRQEGLDLRIWFNRILERQNRQPEPFNTSLNLSPSSQSV